MTRTAPAPAVPTPPPTARLFLAAWPTPGTSAQVASYLAQCRWPPRAAPVSLRRQHLTLHFIGAVDRRRLPEICAGLRIRWQPGPLWLDQPASWPNGIAVLQARVVPPALQALHAALADALRGLQLRVEKRRFRPHLTLARHATDAVLPPLSTPVNWPIDDYVLVESILGTGEYRIVQRYDPVNDVDV
ncbi:MAG TPA: RNA 2',3'-cyclic phosphodiesterase [Accumulibacter sp.]|nr:RNA 2',3'-cyclic phosphodiesterase [Accumulibacter sp.]HMW18958.1 RNA 2',3'-cyclic phosphodiesterase [Accumulibacter sp.]HMX22057.1 RNA 2',3'-cyclic phosphodiesterase [Accumulibacter sp.]HMY07292.1 RNA 2',3'-cyclic phosphodiesterase [Accumulibacter sp.]HNC18553.1 RNA 2',3'-cyclic phosphodiesterase [Accumulibacter sp.]